MKLLIFRIDNSIFLCSLENVLYKKKGKYAIDNIDSNENFLRDDPQD